MTRNRLLWVSLAMALQLPCTAVAQDAEPRTAIVVTGRGLGDTASMPAYRTSELGREAVVSSASGPIPRS